jgi:hypothetical protein
MIRIFIPLISRFNAGEKIYPNYQLVFNPTYQLSTEKNEPCMVAIQVLHYAKLREDFPQIKFLYSIRFTGYSTPRVSGHHPGRADPPPLTKLQLFGRLNL